MTETSVALSRLLTKPVAAITEILFFFFVQMAPHGDSAVVLQPISSHAVQSESWLHPRLRLGFKSRLQ